MTTETRMDGVVSPAEPTVRQRSPASSARAKRQRGWRVNHRLLAWSLGLVAVVSTAVYFWHVHQVRAQADALFERALALHGQEDWPAAAAGFHQYLQLRDDNDPHY